MMRFNINKLQFFTSLLLMAFNSNVLAQTDSVDYQTSQEKKTLSYSYLNIEDYDMKIMYKLIPPIWSGYYGFFGGSISVETKFSRRFSLETGYRLPTHGFHTIFGNVRYYHKQKSSDKPDNLVGSNFMFGLSQYLPDNALSNYIYNDFQRNDFLITTGYGYQGKIGKFGFYNAYALINYSANTGSLSGSMTMNVGLGYGKTSRPSVENLTHFMSEDKRGLLKLSNFGFIYNRAQKGVNIGIDYERKIWKDLTFNTNLYGSIGVYNFISLGEVYEYKNQVITSDIELRYYYNKVRRFRQGKTVRSFTGSYLLLGVEDFFTLSNLPSNYFQPSFTLDQPLFKYPGYYFGSGFQQRIGKNGFVDFNLKAGYHSFYGFDVRSDVKIGLSF